ncbi:hypothetical protein C3489_21755 [Streptomyces sp. Ru71]|nr:hypothetical protein C3489_21755 [Streptomyces sp. Ru71]
MLPMALRGLEGAVVPVCSVEAGGGVMPLRSAEEKGGDAAPLGRVRQAKSFTPVRARRLAGGRA